MTNKTIALRIFYYYLILLLFRIGDLSLLICASFFAFAQLLVWIRSVGTKTTDSDGLLLRTLILSAALTSILSSRASCTSGKVAFALSWSLRGLSLFDTGLETSSICFKSLCRSEISLCVGCFCRDLVYFWLFFYLNEDNFAVLMVCNFKARRTFEQCQTMNSTFYWTTWMTNNVTIGIIANKEIS